MAASTEAHGPYIVTTKRPSGLPHGEHPRDYGYPMTVLSRLAVATLSEARSMAWRVAGFDSVPMPHVIDNVTEAGGTIGPLADGRLIEVKPTDYDELANIVGIDIDPEGDLTASEEHEIIAVYNAQAEGLVT